MNLLAHGTAPVHLCPTVAAIPLSSELFKPLPLLFCVGADCSAAFVFFDHLIAHLQARRGEAWPQFAFLNSPSAWPLSTRQAASGGGGGGGLIGYPLESEPSRLHCWHSCRMIPGEECVSVNHTPACSKQDGEFVLLSTDEIAEEVPAAEGGRGGDDYLMKSRAAGSAGRAPLTPGPVWNASAGERLGEMWGPSRRGGGGSATCLPCPWLVCTCPSLGLVIGDDYLCRPGKRGAVPFIPG